MKHFTVVAVRVFELDEAGHVAAFRLLARAAAYTHAGGSSRAAISSHLGGTARLPPGVRNVVLAVFVAGEAVVAVIHAEEQVAV